MTDLSDLISRVRKAEGPDRELDRLIAGEPMGTTRWAAIPAFTSSIDAITALIEKKLGHAARIDLTINLGAAQHSASIKLVERDEPIIVENARTPALALCLAILLSLQEISK